MCNLSYGLVKQGEEQRTIKNLRSIMNKGYTLLQAFDLLDITSEESEIYKEKLMCAYPKES